MVDFDSGVFVYIGVDFVEDECGYWVCVGEYYF